VRRAAKVDANQHTLVAELRAMGFSVISLAAFGRGCPDLLVGRYGINILVEVKDGSLAPSRRQLNTEQREFHDAWRGPIIVAHTADEVLEACRNQPW